jgi:threonine synthase
MRERSSRRALQRAETAATIAETWKEAAICSIRTPQSVCMLPKTMMTGSVPMVVLGTAHPAKFPDAVEAACGVRPELPENFKDMMTAEERQQVSGGRPGCGGTIYRRSRPGRHRGV